MSVDEERENADEKSQPSAFAMEKGNAAVALEIGAARSIAE